MRIAMEWVDPTDTDSNGPPEACEFLGWGEVEDYTVNIVSNCIDSDADGVGDACDDDDAEDSDVDSGSGDESGDPPGCA